MTIFEADKAPHSPTFHFANQNNEVISDVKYALSFSSYSSGYESIEPPRLPEDYKMFITVTNRDKYQLIGKNYIDFKITPPLVGYDNLKNDFNAVTKKWGNDGNHGVLKENISFDDNNRNVKIKVDGENRRGGALESKDFYDEGSFEFIASTNSKSGACMAFWTFYYADGGNVNNEIDFELFGQNSIIYSSYVSEKLSTHKNETVDFNIPENKVHTYRFDWYKGEKVEYFIDEEKVCEINTNIPTEKMKVWIGAWCPSWAGEAINETSTMTVYSFTYKKF